MSGLTKDDLRYDLECGLNAIGIVFDVNDHEDWIEVSIKRSRVSIVISICDNQYSLLASKRVLWFFEYKANHLFEFDKYSDHADVRIKFWQALIGSIPR